MDNRDDGDRFPNGRYRREYLDQEVENFPITLQALLRAQQGRESATGFLRFGTTERGGLSLSTSAVNVNSTAEGVSSTTGLFSRALPPNNNNNNNNNNNDYNYNFYYNNNIINNNDNNNIGTYDRNAAANVVRLPPFETLRPLATQRFYPIRSNEVSSTVCDEDLPMEAESTEEGTESPPLKRRKFQ